MTRPLVSVGIPLYRSAPFLPGLRANLRALAEEDSVEAIVSDRHGLDDTIDVLRDEWRHDDRFRFLAADDQLDWVEHMNLLLLEARGRYFRWMPHDDLFPRGCLQPLVARLESEPQAILAYGPTRAIDVDGSRLPDRDRLDTHPAAPGGPWTFRHSLDLFWHGSCDGAFKGLFRRAEVVDAGLLIRPTHELVDAERAWLFAVSLLGGLREEPTSQYWKRYHPDSLHEQWEHGPRHVISTTATMCGYLRDLGPGPTATVHGTVHMVARAAGRVRTMSRQPMPTGVISLRNRTALALGDPRVLRDVLPQLRARRPPPRPSPPSSAVRQVVDDLDRRGVAIMHRVAPVELLRQARDDLDLLEERMPSLRGERRTKPRSTGGVIEYEVHEYQSDLRVHRSHDPLVFSAAYARFLLLPEVRDVVAGYLGGSWLYQAMIATRTEPAQPASKGFDMWHHDARGRKLNVFLLLTDVAEDGPATIVLEGTHRLLYRRSRREGNFFEDAEVDALVGEHGFVERACHGPAGSLVFFDANALHRGRRTLHLRDAFQVNCMTDRSHLWPHQAAERILASLDRTDQDLLRHHADLTVTC
jgi:ectoine hydroxylase-related dioxygenase (phytanoyl-CoA dioxygenase family)